MSLIMIESCDDNPSTETPLVKPWVVVSAAATMTVTGSPARNGQSWQAGSSNALSGQTVTEIRYPLSAAERSSTMIFGFAVRPGGNSLSASNPIILFTLRDSSNVVMGTLGMFSTGTALDRWGIRYWRGDTATVVADSGTNDVLYVNNWHYVEIKVTMATGATGSVEVRVNGINRASATNVQTSNSGTTVDRITVLSKYTSAISSGAFPIHFDDIYLCNELGAVNNDFLGPVTVRQIDPSAVGDSTQWTPVGVANNWDNVNDYTSASYNYTNTVGNTDLYNFTDLAAAASGQAVHGVMLAGRFFSDSPPQNMALVTKVGATEVETSAIAVPGGTAGPISTIWETKPGGGAWTYADVNSAQFGVRLK